MGRLLTDEEAVRDAMAADMRGLVLKSHVRSTLQSCLEIERQLGLRDVVFSSLVLNSHRLLEDTDTVIEQIRSGLRILYMPTILARNRRNPLCRDGKRISIMDNGRLCPSLWPMLEAAAEHGCTVATGHCDLQECLALLAACASTGVRTALVTHPEYFVTEMSLEQQQDIADRWSNVLFERTLYSVIDESAARARPGSLVIVKDRLKRLVRHIRELGPERTVLSSDLGQEFLPRPVNGFRHFLEVLADEGVSRADIKMMTRANPLRCLGRYGEVLEQTLRSVFAERRYEFKTPFRQPLLGWVRADDPLFHEFRRCVNERHCLPTDLLSDAATVLAIFLPFGQELVRGNSPGREPSPGWCLAYTEANAFLDRLVGTLGKAIRRLGHESAQFSAVHHLSHCHDPNVAPDMLSSTWSQRHIAYACGLGAFGLNNLLITEKGCAGRFSSLVTNMPLPSRPRSTAERCLAKAGKDCDACVSRCPANAFGPKGFDRARCWRHLIENNHVSRNHGYTVVNVCGKCSVGIPCDMTSPVAT